MTSTPDRKALGQIVRSLREHEGLSRAELAQRAQLGTDMVAKIEQGAKAPSAASLRRLAVALGVEAKDLSNRTLVWSALLADNEKSATVLRSIAIGSFALADTIRRAGVGHRAIVSAAAIGAAAGAAGGAAASFASERRDRAEFEKEIRVLLERRLDDAKSDQDLAAIAEALEGVAETD